jgi:hypothetical protein
MHLQSDQLNFHSADFASYTTSSKLHVANNFDCYTVTDSQALDFIFDGSPILPITRATLVYILLNR